MSFRLTTKALLRTCTNASRTIPSFKNVPLLKFHNALKANSPALHYSQSRGIFWNEKKKEENGTEKNTKEEETKNTEEKEKEEKQAEAKEETTETKAQTNKANAKAEKTTAQESSTKQEETQKTQTDAKKAPKEAPETFEKLIESLPLEAKKKAQALWQKLEKDLQDTQKQVREAKSNSSNLDKANADSKQKIEDLRTRLKEEVDERELMRKRFDKELEASKVFAITKFANDLLDVPDNLGRALDASKGLEGKGDNLFDGVKATNTILLKTLEKHGIKQVSPMGEKFNPNYHEALFDFDDPSKKPGSVGYVAGVGYVLNDRCLRPAKVGVVKGQYVEEKEGAKAEAK